MHVERFKQFTRNKLRGVRCPLHGQPPHVHFRGDSLRDITVSMTGCCAALMELANARIAGIESASLAPGSGEPLRGILPRVAAG